MVDPIQFEPLKPIDVSGFSWEKKLIQNVQPTGGIPASPSFRDVLKDSVKKVNDLGAEADSLVKRLSLGEVEDISEVSIAVEKAELALRMMVQIRDKLVDAYQQVSRMSV
jgi:flagellar hook-basal body complex protein FliE